MTDKESMSYVALILLISLAVAIYLLSIADDKEYPEDSKPRIWIAYWISIAIASIHAAILLVQTYLFYIYY